MESFIRDTVESLWNELVTSRFEENDFVDTILIDCGHDASGISKSDFLELLNTGSCEPMEDMAWCCNEVLNFYLDDGLGNSEFVRAMFVASCAVVVVQKGFGHWDFMFDKICKLLVQNMDKVDYEFRMRFLRHILC